MATCIWKTADGTLVSYNPDDTSPVADPTTLAAKGLTATSGLHVLDSTHVWDAPTHTVVVVTAQSQSNMIDAMSFWLLFTAAELAGIRASADTTVQRVMFAISQTNNPLDLNSTPMKNLINQCVTLGLLTTNRGAAILQAGS